MKEASQITFEIYSLLETWENKLAGLPAEAIMQRRNSQNLRSLEQEDWVQGSRIQGEDRENGRRLERHNTA